MEDRSFFEVNFHAVVQKIMERENIQNPDACCLVDEEGFFIKFHEHNPQNMPELARYFEGRDVHSLFPPHLSSSILFHIRMAGREDKLVSTVYEHRSPWKAESEALFHVAASFLRTSFFWNSKRVLAGFFSVLSVETSSRTRNDLPAMPLMPQEKYFHFHRAKLVREILSNASPLHPKARETLYSFGITETAPLFVSFICEPLHENPCIWAEKYSEEHLLSFYSWQSNAVRYLTEEAEIFSWCCSEGIGLLFPFTGEQFAYADSKGESIQMGEAILNALHYILPRKRLAMGIGGKPCFLSEIRTALRQARKAASGGLFGLHGGVFHYQDLGYGLLLHQKPCEEDAYMENILQPLLPQEREKPELLLTLEALLEKNSLAEAAQQMHVHINTMGYRKKQIETLLMVDLNDSRTKANLLFAVKSWKIHYIHKFHEDALLFCQSYGEITCRDGLE